MIKRIIAVILSLLLIVFSFCGCSGTELLLPVSIRPKQPDLVLTGEYPYELPGILNASWGKTACSVIFPSLSPVIDALKLANSEEVVAHTHYELTPSESGGFTLDVYVRSASVDGGIKLVSFDIAPDGTVYLPEFSVPEYMYDGDWLNGYLRLSRYGLDPALPEAGSMLTTADICRLLVDYYEACTGLTVDTSRVRIKSEDVYLLKSLALGLCSSQYDYENSTYAVFITQQNRMLEKLMGHLHTDMLGRGNYLVSQDDIFNAINLFLRLYFKSPANAEPYMPIISGSDILPPDNAEELTRHEIALIYNAIYEHCFGELNVPEEKFFYDFSTSALETAYHMGFIDCFPSYALSSFDYHPSEYQLFSLAEHYANSCYWKQWTYGQSETAIDRRALITMLGWADSFLDRYEPPESGVIEVDNSRNYQWYFAQFNTGEYSDINCMPTLAAMGIKWYRPDSSVTPEDLRNLWLPELDGGWYMAQVADSLEHYDVPFEWHDMSEKLTEHLDQGKIILTQMSEASFDASGHCFIIYGYRRIGDCVQYMINDPGVYDGIDSLGKPPGEAMLLDGAYAEWVICRMTYSYITVG